MSVSSSAAAAAAIAHILSAGKAAAGGAALDAVRSFHFTERVSLIGVAGTADEWDDAIAGRTVVRTHAGPLSGAEGFDGATSWQQDATGVVHPVGGYADVANALTQAYFLSNSEFYRDRRQGAVSDPRVVAKAGATDDVVTITPSGGLPTDVYFDSTTHLIAREVMHYAPYLSYETDFSDYRTVDGVSVPFRTVESDSNGNGQTTTIETARTGVAPPSGYGMPRSTAADFSVSGGTSTTIPIEIENNHIYLDARVDGKGPFRFIFDTGGQALLDPDVAAKLGIISAGALNATGAGAGSVPGGFAWVPAIDVGGATMRHQAAAIIPLGQTIGPIEGVHIDGMVGWEMAARYVVTVDYLHGTMTLRMPGGPRPSGIRVPIVFADTLPEIHAAVDGIAGTFDVDTGNRQSLMLGSPFVAAHDLRRKYPSRAGGVTGYGVGGPTTAQLVRVKSLTIAGIDVPDVVTSLSTDTAGAGADPGPAGNLGGGVWKRFVVTFDYPDGAMYLQPNADFSRRDSYDRSGLFLAAGKKGLEALSVLSGTPAAGAGLSPGTMILSVNGRSVSSLGLLGVRRILSGPAGSAVSLHCVTHGAARDVTITLRDYV
jgi:hypothetical protein